MSNICRNLQVFAILLFTDFPSPICTFHCLFQLFCSFSHKKTFKLFLSVLSKLLKEHIPLLWSFNFVFIRFKTSLHRFQLKPKSRPLPFHKKPVDLIKLFLKSLSSLNLCHVFPKSRHWRGFWTHGVLKLKLSNFILLGCCLLFLISFKVLFLLFA